MYNDEETLAEERRQRGYERERQKISEFKNRHWNYITCKSCMLVNCICGYKDAQMNSEFDERA